MKSEDIRAGASYQCKTGKKQIRRDVERIVRTGPNPRVEFMETGVNGEPEDKKMTLRGFARSVIEELARPIVPLYGRGTDRTAEHGCFGWSPGLGSDGGAY